MHVVLVEPRIHYNTGNIARTCVATGSELHLVGPLGFSLDDRHLRRAGLDYWPLLRWHRHADLSELWAEYPRATFHYFSTHGVRGYHEVRYGTEDFLVFGSETAGLPGDLLAAHPDSVRRIPMRPGVRSLNLANAVALVLYEAWRQNGFVWGWEG